MAGTIHEFFGYLSTDRSAVAAESAETGNCPFIGEKCVKELKGGVKAGACSIKPMTTGPVICCPMRLYADDYRILRDVSDKAFSAGLKLAKGRTAVSEARRLKEPVVAVFGKRWGGELRLPKRDGSGNYFVDWVLALVDETGALAEFVAVEVQTIDTTGNYHASRSGLMSPERTIVKSTVGLNWENVSKRIIPQLIYKGQILQREEYCKKGLFFVCPSPVYAKIAARLGGEDKLVRYALQPASITFMSYDYDSAGQVREGELAALRLEASLSTTVYKMQEAFNNVQLPEENVYKSTIEAAFAEAYKL